MGVIFKGKDEQNAKKEATCTSNVRLLPYSPTSKMFGKWWLVHIALARSLVGW
jgi:hypothetical protein